MKSGYEHCFPTQPIPWKALGNVFLALNLFVWGVIIAAKVLG